jgi:hypothetical protein
VKVTVMLSAVLLCQSIVVAKSPLPTSVQEGLKGRVRRVAYSQATLEKAGAKVGQAERIPTLIVQYNASGERTQLEGFHNGKPSGLIKIKSAGPAIEYWEDHINPEGSFMTLSSEPEKDERGWYVFRSSYKFQYDGNGYWSRKTHFDETGVTQWEDPWVEYVYNSKGHRLEEKAVRPADGSYSYREVKKYGSKDQ